jgi:putative ABC transport system permease protein
VVVETLLTDVRYALRKLGRSPAFAAVALVTLALGIGTTTAIFSVVDGVLIRSLPFDRPDELVSVYTEYPNDEGSYPLSAPDLMSVAADVDVFSDVVAYYASPRTLTDEGEPAELPTAVVSRDYFRVLGAQPVLGRAFTAEEHEPGRTDVVVLSHGAWTTRFGADPGILGRGLTLNGNPYTVVGVLPAGAGHPARTELYLPVEYTAQFDATTAQGRRSEWLYTVARLRPGATPADATPALAALSERLRQDFPQTNAMTFFTARPLRDELLGAVRTPLLILLGAVALVLLIAVANVANLMLARATARQGELNVRAALGAGRGRLVRQLLTESVVLGLAGGALGLLLAAWGTSVLVSAAPEGLPRAAEIGMDPRIAAFALVVSVGAGLAFGLLPAFQVGRRLSASLRDGRGAGTARSTTRFRSGLVVAEMALAVVLLIGAGLLLRSFQQLMAVDPGFNAERVITFDVSLPPSGYESGAPVRNFYDQLLARIEGLPGVRSVAMTSTLPLSGGGNIWSFGVPGRDRLVAEDQVQDLVVKIISPEYLRTIGAVVQRGRGFTEADGAEAPAVVLLNEAAVRRYFPEEDPLGIMIDVGRERGPSEVVGIVRDVKQYGLHTDARAEVYFPHRDLSARGMTVVVRAAGDAAGLPPLLRRELHALDPNLPLERFVTLEEVVSRSAATQRFLASLVTLFAGLALALAAIGIFGVMSYAVVQRTREIGVRMALGAPKERIVSMLLGRGLGLAGLGAVIGLGAALMLSGVLRTQLFGVSATDILTYVAVTVTLMAVAGVACYLPARRATQVDPMIALREE